MQPSLARQTRARTLSVIDSHTAGEPTRVVISGGPDLGRAPLPERVQRFRREFDLFRSAVVDEPRGSQAIVGALLCEPLDPASTAAVIFFNNTGYLGMCGHGTIGLLVTLSHLGRIVPGEHKIETPVGTITALLHDSNTVTVRNVASYRLAANMAVNVPGFGTVLGDVAWGGNWFFQINEHSFDLNPQNIDVLTHFAWSVRQALQRNGITGRNDAEIDHIELLAPSHRPGIDSRNFVLCPGKAYDRSPCGTGTSAKLACLFEDGKLREGQIWRQESIIGSVFEGSVQICGGQIVPSIRGSAYITAEAELVLDPNDPFCHGISV